MADFATHLGWGAVGAGLAASATYAADIVPSSELLTLTMAGVVGSVLPDIDLEKTVPARSLFTGLGLVLAFIVLFNFKASYSIVELWLIWLAVFCAVRYGAYNVFEARTIHRGIFHSILAGLFFMVATAVLLTHGIGREPLVAWMAGLFVLFGFLIHLTLDEIYAVDITGVHLKRSFGTALKLYDSRSIRASCTMLGALFIALAMAPSASDFLRIMHPDQVSQFFRQRMFPQGRWFEMRAPVAAASRQPDDAGSIAASVVEDAADAPHSNQTADPSR
jgi:LexA-binding, inner membrane-associated putative hydrolase